MRYGMLLGLVANVLLLCACNRSTTVKAANKQPPVVHVAHLSGSWYSHQQALLSQELDYYFTCAREYFPVVTAYRDVRALVVPHAGMYFSGLCAATAYQTLMVPQEGHEGSVDTGKQTIRYEKNTGIKRVVVLCPSHTAFLKGCALPRFDVYQTSLGDIPIDRQACEMLAVTPVFRGDSRVHEQEHAIEIQLPFLQKTIADFKLVPLVVGHVTDEDINDVIYGLTKIVDKDTLVVISTDFIHHGPGYDYNVFDRNIIHNIRYLDSLAVNALSAQDYRGFENFLRETGATICGQNPLKVLLGLINKSIIEHVNARLTCYYTAAHMRKARLPDQRIAAHVLLDNLADQDAQENVSYIGMIFTTQSYQELKKEDILTGYEKKELLSLARRTIANAFVDKKDRLPDNLLYPLMSFGMQQQIGAFVTLNTKTGELRGCIGSMVAQEPLCQTVMRMAVAAAFQDSRFVPLMAKELDNVVIDISLLTPPVPVASYEDIKIGKHGIVLYKLGPKGTVVASAVFLPQVPSSYGWSKETTLGHLSTKAGLAWSAWKTDCAFEVFEGYELKE